MIFNEPSFAFVPLTSDSDADAIIGAYTGATAPDRDKRLVTSAVKAFKRDSLWNLIEALWVPAAQDAASGDVNWKTPGTHNLTRVNSPSHLAYAGLLSDGSTSYANTGINLGDGGSHLATQNSTTLFVATATDSTTGICFGTTISRILARNTNLNASVRVHSSAGAGTNNGEVPTSAGSLVSASRRDASNVYTYHNGTLSSFVGASVSATPDNVPLYLCAIRGVTNPGSFAGQRVSAAGIFAGMTDAQSCAVHAIAWTYLHGVNPAAFP